MRNRFANAALMGALMSLPTADMPHIPKKDEIPVAKPETYRTKGEKRRYRDLSSKRGKRRGK